MLTKYLDLGAFPIIHPDKFGFAISVQLPIQLEYRSMPLSQSKFNLREVTIEKLSFSYPKKQPFLFCSVVRTISLSPILSELEV